MLLLSFFCAGDKVLTLELVELLGSIWEKKFELVIVSIYEGSDRSTVELVW